MKQRNDIPDTPGWRFVRHFIAISVVAVCVYLSVKLFAAGYLWGGAMALAGALGALAGPYADDT